MPAPPTCGSRLPLCKVRQGRRCARRRDAEPWTRLLLSAATHLFRPCALAGQLSECEAEIAALERQAAAADAAAAEEPGARQAVKQAAALQRELLHLAQSTATEQRRLQAAAVEVGRRAEGLQAASHERREAAATWRRRVQLMASSHEPLSPAQERRRCESRQRFWGRNV